MYKVMLLFWVIPLLDACTHHPISWDRTATAAQHAASHSSVWMPILGAGLLAFDNLDNRSAKHIGEETQIFGDADSASNASDNMRSLLTTTAIISAVIVPVREGESAMAIRGNHLAVTAAGMEVTRGITNTMKDAVGRERPNKSNDLSFPSGHSSQAFAGATFASNNFQRRNEDNCNTPWVDAGLYTVASLTGWARIEAGVHHPADVLAGAALGNFISRFLDELLLTNQNNAALSVYVDERSFFVGVEHSF